MLVHMHGNYLWVGCVKLKIEHFGWVSRVEAEVFEVSSVKWRHVAA